MMLLNLIKQSQVNQININSSRSHHLKMSHWSWMSIFMHILKKS